MTLTWSNRCDMLAIFQSVDSGETYRRHEGSVSWPFGVTRVDDGWALIHLPSGYVVDGGVFRSQRAAQKCAEQWITAVPQAPWGKTKALRAHREAREVLKAIRVKR